MAAALKARFGHIQQRNASGLGQSATPPASSVPRPDGDEAQRLAGAGILRHSEPSPPLSRRATDGPEAALAPPRRRYPTPTHFAGAAQLPLHPPVHRPEVLHHLWRQVADGAARQAVRPSCARPFAQTMAVSARALGQTMEEITPLRRGPLRSPGGVTPPRTVSAQAIVRRPDLRGHPRQHRLTRPLGVVAHRLVPACTWGRTNGISPDRLRQSPHLRGDAFTRNALREVAR